MHGIVINDPVAYQMLWQMEIFCYVCHPGLADEMTLWAAESPERCIGGQVSSANITLHVNVMNAVAVVDGMTRFLHNLNINVTVTYQFQ